MATKSPEEIISDIQTHSEKEGGDKSTWKVGVIDNPKFYLFETLKLNKENSWWIYRLVGSNSETVELKKKLISIGFSEGHSTNTPESTYIYAYKSIN
ncbi:MAG: hypothetical protein ACOZCO_08615 [Bacteroidota bacterium]